MSAVAVADPVPGLSHAFAARFDEMASTVIPCPFFGGLPSNCCLVVYQKLINEKPEVARDLVRGIISSGEWIVTNCATAEDNGDRYDPRAIQQDDANVCLEWSAVYRLRNSCDKY